MRALAEPREAARPPRSRVPKRRLPVLVTTRGLEELLSLLRGLGSAQPVRHLQIPFQRCSTVQFILQLSSPSSLKIKDPVFSFVPRWGHLACSHQSVTPEQPGRLVGVLSVSGLSCSCCREDGAGCDVEGLAGPAGAALAQPAGGTFCSCGFPSPSLAVGPPPRATGFPSSSLAGPTRAASWRPRGAAAPGARASPSPRLLAVLPRAAAPLRFAAVGLLPFFFDSFCGGTSCFFNF